MMLHKYTKNLLLCVSMAAPAIAWADDIDLFQGISTSGTGKPNVLIIVDNSANWNSSAQHWPGGIKQGQSELRALATALKSGLANKSNVGLMMFVKGQGGSEQDGGYMRFGVRDMSVSANRDALMTILTGGPDSATIANPTGGMYANFNSENTGQQVATANTKYGEAMYEAWRYFSGLNPYAGPGSSNLRDYAGNGSPSVSPYTAGSIAGNALASINGPYNSPLSADAPCAKNFIIFIGNGFPSNSSASPTTYAEQSDLVDTTNDPNRWVQIYPEGTATTYADEWARFLKLYGAKQVCSGGVCADGKIITYTIDVYKDHQDTSETKLLKSMANVGGGSYCVAQSESAILTCLTNAFSDIQAVNSVFTSASLPVAINTQGLYLNQIYMGVFRPDEKGKPRWWGNLKEYKFGLTTNAQGLDELFLSDADGHAAVNPTTGFIKPTARSYWTYSTAPASGYWSFRPNGQGGQYDSPDGDLVEKGAAAQKLRDITPASRRVYTCLPQEGCTSGATPVEFVSTNDTLKTELAATSNLFGDFKNVTLSRQGTTVTGTLTSTDAAALGLDAPTSLISISNSTVSDYNGGWTASHALNASTFTFNIDETPATPATGTSITVSAGATSNQPISTGNMTYSNGKVTINLSGHGFVNGQQVTVSGAAISAAMSGSTTATTISDTYSGSTLISNSSSTTSSSPTTVSGPTTTVSGNTTTTVTQTQQTSTTTDQSLYRRTETIIQDQFSPCSGWTSTSNCEYNGVFNITDVTSNSFSYTPPSSNFGKTTRTTTSKDWDTTRTTTTAVTTTTTTTTTTTKVESPPSTFATSYGTASLSCKKGSGSTTYSLPITSMTRVSGTGTKAVTLILDGSTAIADCNVPLVLNSGSYTAGTSNSAGSVTAFSISGSNSSNGLNGSPVLTSAGTSCSSGQSRAICFNITVTLVDGTPTTTSTSSTGSPVVTGPTSSTETLSATRTETADTTLIPSSPAVADATGTIYVTGRPTKAVTSITRTAGNSNNVATVTVTTSSAHGFSGQSNITIAGADQTEYNGTKTTGASGDNLQFPDSTTITYTLTTGPTASATARVAKGDAVAADALIDWVRGMDNKDDENGNQVSNEIRASVHGDVLHSRPVVINYGGTTGIIAFYGGNDGMLHAVKAGSAATDGVEKWAFVAPEHFPTLTRIYNNNRTIRFSNMSADDVAAKTPTPTKRDYYFDGNIGVYQSADLQTTHIFAATRRGGRFIYALDVSNPDSPQFLWKKGCPNLTNNTGCDTGFATDGNGARTLGQTWSEPKVIPVKATAGVSCIGTDSSTYNLRLIFGGGYDPQRDDDDGLSTNPAMGNGVWVLNAADGSVVKRFEPTGAYRFAADLALLDTDGDGCIDRVYGVDTGANIYRFDIGDPDPVNWKTYKIAELRTNNPSNKIKFLYPPSVVTSYVNGNRITHLLLGSGDRENPLDETVQNYFFMVKDTTAAGTAPSSVSATTFDQLTQVTQFDPDATGALTSVQVEADTFKGWYIQYPNNHRGEKTVNAALTVASVTTFGTNQPRSTAIGQCTPNLGTARIYSINFLTGTAISDKDQNGVINFDDTYSTQAGGGLPPTSVTGVVEVDGKLETFQIGCDRGAIEGCKVQGEPNSNRKRVYWYFKKDQ